MASYQNLSSYIGSMYGAPTYSGIEYDFEVPDNLVVSSPGGVSSTHHYFNKGFYGNLSSTPDIYAGEGRMYPYGILGNEYQYGQTSAVHQKIFDTPPDQMFTQNNSTPTIKEAFELIPPPEEYTSVEHLSEKKEENIWVVFIFLIIFYTALVFASLAFKEYVNVTYYSGKMTWKGYTLFAVIFLFVSAVYLSLTNVSLKGSSL